MGSVSELADFLVDIDIREQALKATIQEAKFKQVKKSEKTLIKQRIKDIARGVREGTISTKQQIKPSRIFYNRSKY